MTPGPSAGRAKLTLRIAAALATIQAIAHLILFLRSLPGPGSSAWSLAQAMRVQAGPEHSTYWGMYFGYGLLSALTAALVAGLIWLGAAFANDCRTMARWLIGLVGTAVVLHAIVIGAYFFRVPLWFDLLVAALLAIGWMQLRE